MSMDGFKRQMALIDLKGRREAYKSVLPELKKRGVAEGSLTTFLNNKIAELTQQIEVIEGKRLTVKEQE